ncbi:hypothetical protein CASFOL_009650 [Castilleja foliolosa]|uniref:Anther-specific protein BCP1-like n=1 Tax=Castilleja foliolosa TaxID=1961234 RepID=A0ABD3DUC7_9LAMI
MANQIIVIALILVAAVGMASASTAAPSLAPAAASGSTGNSLSEGPTVSNIALPEGPTGESTDNTIGTISGGGSASDAAPVGGPVPNGVFEDLTPSNEPAAPANGATALEVSVVAAAGVIGSMFL